MPHETWHVVQQAKGRVKPTTAEHGHPINDDPGLEHEAQQMGARALAHEAAAPKTLQRIPDHSAPVQRVYAGLAAVDQARVDQRADADYAAKAQAFEFGMAPLIMANASVNASIDAMLAKLKTIVDQWAAHTGQELGAVYEHEFGWPPGDGYYGAFEMTAQNIAAVFEDTTQPLRLKLKLIYNAVRNNALAKWLKVAGLELDRAARGKKPQTTKVRSEGQTVDRSGDQPRRVSKTKRENVAPGFAEASGIAGFHSEAETKDLIGHAKNERRRTRIKGAPNRREIFDHAHMSNTLGWKPATTKANTERAGHANRHVAEKDLRRINQGDVGTLADSEIDLILARRGLAGVSPASREIFRSYAANKLPWGQGGDFYDVNLGSDSAKEAERVKARMESGISGSTDLMLHAGEHLGIKGTVQKMPLRLALAGWMIAARDHSFYEVYKSAEAYGVKFHMDPARPGSEYEHQFNLAPMRRSDFQAILPAEGNVANVFPALYQTQAWKDYLAATMTTGVQDEAAIKTQLTGAGIEPLSLSTMTERDLAAVQRLQNVVQNQALTNPADKSERKQAMRRMREDVSYIYLGNLFGPKRANRMLIELVSHRHGLPDLTEVDIDDVPAKYKEHVKEKQPYIARLRRAGLPDVIIDFASLHDLSRLDSVRRDISNLTPPPPGSKIAPTTYLDRLSGAGGLQGLDDTRKQMAVAALIRKYHPGAEPTNLARDADAMNRIREFEQIINMEHTTATWYSWGGADAHNMKIEAPSLRETTFNVPSTQGPGLYVAHTVVNSSAYGNIRGQRVLVVKMSNVPTVNINNAGQMERLNRLLGYGGAQLERSGLYDKKIRAEFLMIYGNGSLGRLTTNQGVTLTMDLKEAPKDHLQHWFPVLDRWNGDSRANFIDQAKEHKLSLKGWT